MNEEEFEVVLFDSSNIAIYAEETARSAGFNVRCIPTPRNISSNCGIVLRIRKEDAPRILESLKKQGIKHISVISHTTERRRYDR